MSKNILLGIVLLATGVVWHYPELPAMKPTDMLVLILLLAPVYGHATAVRTKAPASKTQAKADDSSKDDDDDDDDDEVATPAANAKATATATAAKTVAQENDDEDDDVMDAYEIQANVALASDYILRGLTQTNHQPAIQGGLDWEHPWGFFLSLSAANVRFAGSPTSIETDWSGGYKYQFTTELSTKLGIQYYWYYNDHERSSWDVPLVTEWKGFQLQIEYSPRWEGENHPAWYVNLGWEHEVIWGTTLGAFAGYSFYPDTSEAPKYADFKISVSHEFLGLDWQIDGIFTKVQKIQRQEEIIDPEDPELTQTVSHELTWGGSRAVFSVGKSF